jgi:type I restriction enzyme M protein
MESLCYSIEFLANPMWNQKEWSREWLEKGDPYGRVKYALPSKSSGDWMWIQHMMATLNSKGMLGIVLDNGVLFRGGQEKICRQGYLEDDLLEAVVSLPGNLFYNTSSPGCVLIFNKAKPSDRQGKVLFIDASSEYEEGKAQNFLRTKHMDKIEKAFNGFIDVEKFASVVDLEKIKKNDYSLNVPIYVNTTEDEEIIDVKTVNGELKELIAKRDGSYKEMQNYLKELGYDD